MKENLDKLRAVEPDAKKWLEREPYECWSRSYFDASTKCEHVTNNFSKSFNNLIVKIRDKPLNKMVEMLNLMQMTLMYERKLKPTREIGPPPLLRLAGRLRTLRRREAYEVNGVVRQPRRCNKCQAFGYNNITCKGQPVEKPSMGR
ncbi:hypothetical protein GIB67_016661 [Kingdonia uniflora]|uniref:Uncharacterized protein n=1 Tax=Kingdonia uniflora TaxID=39325 RepID=A0A7J7MZ70_9MAGN|nr:hypothetical protein GIB67_016661 [Kingdonia uniflora]